MWALYGPHRPAHEAAHVFDGPARIVAREMWCTTAATATSTVPMRPPMCFGGLARAVAHEMWCTTATITTSWGVSGSLSTKNNYVRTMHYWQIASGIIKYNMMPCANVGAKPWYRCGCTDDTPCRLGDAGSITFLPWFVPWTEPPVQLREDRGHLLTESCSDVSCVSMSNRG